MTSTHDTKDLDFRIFRGPINQQMPKLIATGLVPASAAQIMQGRLEGKLSFDEYHESGDAILYNYDGRIKLVREFQDLHSVDKENRLHDGALVLLDSIWGVIDGEILSREDALSSSKLRLSKQEVLRNRIWQWLAHDDTHLLKEYTGDVFRRVKKGCGLALAMGVYLNEKMSSIPVLRLWTMGDTHNGEAGGNFSLDARQSHMVGVEPRTPRYGLLATYRDAPQRALEHGRESKQRTLWDILNTPIQNLFGESNDE